MPSVGRRPVSAAPAQTPPAPAVEAEAAAQATPDQAAPGALLEGSINDQLPDALALRNVGAQLRLPGQTTLGGDWAAEMRTTSATTVWVELSHDGLRISMWPPLLVDAQWPLSNVEVRGLTYDFRTGTVTNVDAANTQFAIPMAGTVANTLRDMAVAMVAGTPVGQPGYDPFTDADLAGTLAGMQRNLASSASGGAAPVQPGQIDQIALSAGITVLGGVSEGSSAGGIEIPSGGAIDLRAGLQGTLADVTSGRPPVLQYLSISSPDAITLTSEGEPIARLQDLVVNHGGAVRVNRYEALGSLRDAEQTESGLRALALLLQLGIAREGGNPGPLVTDLNPGVVQGVASAKMGEALTRAVRAMVEANHAALPGIDLRTALGMGP